MISPLNASKITTFECDFLLFNISIEANNEDPGQTARKGAVWSGSSLLKRLQNMLTVKTKTYNFLYMCFKGKLMWVQCIYSHDFHEIRTRLHAQTTYFFFNQIINKTWFPFISR